MIMRMMMKMVRFNDDVDDGEDDGYEDDDEDGQVNVHVTAFGDHAQNTGICSIFCSLYNMLRKDVETRCHKHPSTATCLRQPCRY